MVPRLPRGAGEAAVGQDGRDPRLHRRAGRGQERGVRLVPAARARGRHRGAAAEPAAGALRPLRGGALAPDLRADRRGGGARRVRVGAEEPRDGRRDPRAAQVQGARGGAQLRQRAHHDQQRVPGARRGERAALRLLSRLGRADRGRGAL